MIGNPSVLSGPFYDAFHSLQSFWHTIKIAQTDNPHFTGEPVGEELLTMLPSKEWVEEQKTIAERTGRLDEYAWSVLAEFPKQNQYSIVDAEKLSRSRQRRLPDDQDNILWDDLSIAVDVARDGGDRTVMAYAEGPRARLAGTMTGRDLEEVSGWIIETVREQALAADARKRNHGRDDFSPENVHITIDGDGLGIGVFDRVRPTLEAEGYNVYDYRGGAKPVLPQNIAYCSNRRAESWFNFSELLSSDEMDLPNDDGLAEELLEARKVMTGDGKRKVEPKETTKKRLGRSPDVADAILMLYAPKHSHSHIVIHK